MKGLKHGKTERHAEVPSRITNLKRGFFRLGAAGVLATSLTLTGVGAALLMPTPAKAEYKEIVKGVKATVVKLDKSLIKLDKETEKYRAGEYFPDSANKMQYQIGVQIQGEVTFLVSISQDGRGRLSAAFPPEREVGSDGVKAGIRGADLTGFARLVRAITGEKLARVRIILDGGSFEYKGKTTKFTNAYVLPVDSEGKVITNVGQGQYLVYVATYYADKVLGDIGLLVEPNNKTTLEVAQR